MPQHSLNRLILQQEELVRRLSKSPNHPDLAEAKNELERLYVQGGRNPDGSQRMPFGHIDPGLNVGVSIPNSMKPITASFSVGSASNETPGPKARPQPPPESPPKPVIGNWNFDAAIARIKKGVGLPVDYLLVAPLVGVPTLTPKESDQFDAFKSIVGDRVKQGMFVGTHKEVPTLHLKEPIDGAKAAARNIGETAGNIWHNVFNAVLGYPPSTESRQTVSDYITGSADPATVIPSLLAPEFGALAKGGRFTKGAANAGKFGETGLAQEAKAGSSGFKAPTFKQAERFEPTVPSANKGLGTSMSEVKAAGEALARAARRTKFLKIQHLYNDWLKTPDGQRWLAAQKELRKANKQGLFDYIDPKTRVEFVDGYPVFKDVKEEVWIDLTGNRKKDFELADERAGFAKGQRPQGYTWNHHQDNGRMQLVDRKIHKDTLHNGSMAIRKRYLK